MTRKDDMAVPSGVMGLTIIQGLVQALIAQIEAVRSIGDDPVLSRQLGGLDRACQAFRDTYTSSAVAVPSLVDTSVFDRLMQLAGPDMATDLLDRLAEDLQSVREALGKAHQQADWQALRSQSHILMGLAGAVGAHDLHAQAQRVNGAAHTENPGQITLHLLQLLPGLDSLMAFVHLERTAPLPMS